MLMGVYRSKSAIKSELSPFVSSDSNMHCGPPPRPWLLGFRRPLLQAAEPDHPPSTLLLAGGPARLVVSADVCSVLWRGGGRVGCPHKAPRRDKVGLIRGGDGG